MNYRKLIYLAGLLFMVALFVYADTQLMEVIARVEHLNFIPSTIIEQGILALLLMIFSFSAGMMLAYKAVWGK